MDAPRDVVAANLAAVRERIRRAAERSGRDPAEVTLVAVTKTVAVERIRWILEERVVDVGENYVQELRVKAQALPQARWHFVGTLQTGSAHHVAAHADVVETVAAGRATDRLARRAASSGRVLDALIEIDFTGARTGIPPEDLPEVADRVASLPGLRPIGLMTIPSFPSTAEQARPTFARMRELRDRIRERHPDVLALSMGMSLDYEVAVEEGATMVRIGTALFGPRV